MRSIIVSNMKKKKLLGNFLFVVAILYYIETDPSQFCAEKSSVIHLNRDELFKFIVFPDTVERWFRMIIHFRSADSKSLAVGKLYQVVYSLPMLGSHVMLLNLTKYDPQHSQVILESQCFFKTRVEITTVPFGPHDCSTNLTIKLTFRRPSMLFQWTLAPLLQYNSLHHLNHSMHLLDKMVPV